MGFCTSVCSWGVLGDALYTNILAHVHIHVCMYVCMYVCIHIDVDIHLFLNIYSIYAVEIIDDSCLRCSSERQGASHIVVFGGKGRKR